MYPLHMKLLEGESLKVLRDVFAGEEHVLDRLSAKHNLQIDSRNQNDFFPQRHFNPPF